MNEAMGLAVRLSSLDDPIFTVVDFDDTTIHLILEQGDF